MVKVISVLTMAENGLRVSFGVRAQIIMKIRCTKSMYHSVLGKPPWVLAVQPLKLGGGRLPEGGA